MNANLYHGDAVVATSKQPSFSTGTSASGENWSKIQDGGYPSRRIYASTLDSNPLQAVRFGIEATWRIRSTCGTLMVRVGGAAGGWLTHVPQGPMVVD